MDETAFRIGRLEAHVSEQSKIIQRIESKTDTQTQKLDQLLGQRAVEHGAKRTRKALIMGGAGVFGWVIGIIVEWLKK